jgi:hypothetical protein
MTTRAPALKRLPPLRDTGELVSEPTLDPQPEVEPVPLPLPPPQPQPQPEVQPVPHPVPQPQPQPEVQPEPLPLPEPIPQPVPMPQPVPLPPPQPQRPGPVTPGVTTTPAREPRNLPRRRHIPRLGAAAQYASREQICTCCMYPLCNVEPMAAWTLFLAVMIIGAFMVLLFFLPAFAQWTTGIIGFLLGVLFPSPLQANKLNRAPTTPDQQAQVITNLERAVNIDEGGSSGGIPALNPVTNQPSVTRVSPTPSSRPVPIGGGTVMPLSAL